MASYPRLMAQLGYSTPAAFQNVWLNRLRKVWNKVTGELADAFVLRRGILPVAAQSGGAGVFRGAGPWPEGIRV